MSSQFNLTWGVPLLVDTTTNAPITVSHSAIGDVNALLFGAGSQCELRATDPRLMRHWMFTLHQGLQVKGPRPTTIQQDLRYYVDKPADAEVTVRFRAGGKMGEVVFPVGQAVRGPQILTLVSPFLLESDGYEYRLEVIVRRPSAASEVIAQFDSVDLVMQ